jgi:hypothetical protein
LSGKRFSALAFDIERHAENDMKPLAGSEESAAGGDPANLASPAIDWDRVLRILARPQREHLIASIF